MKKIKVQAILKKEKLQKEGDEPFLVPDGSTVEDLLSLMAKIWGDKLSPYLYNKEADTLSRQPRIARIMINDVDIASLSGMATTLEDGDDIEILPVSGHDIV